MDLGISGRTAIVCASSKGLGRGCAQALAEARRLESLGKLKPAFAALAEMAGFDDVALQKYHSVEKIDE